MPLSFQDEFSKHVQEWNNVRMECVDLALRKMLIPELRKELKSVLLNESKECVLRSCCRRLYNWIKVLSLLLDVLYFPMYFKSGL